MPLDNGLTRQLLKELASVNFNEGPQVIEGRPNKFDTVFKPEHYQECLRLMAGLIVEVVNPHVLIRVMKSHAEIPVSHYSTEVVTPQKSYLALDLQALNTIVAEGATVNLNMLERLSPYFSDFSKELEIELNCRLQTNLYYNEGTISGFSPHYDTHDLFVCQIHGEKRWQISRTVTPNVSAATPSTPDSAPKTFEEDVVLCAGDLIVLPRGTWHSVTGTGQPSLHLTIGLRTPTFEDYLRWLGSHAGASQTLRQKVSTIGISERLDSAAILAQGLAELSQRGVNFDQFLIELSNPIEGRQ